MYEPDSHEEMMAAAYAGNGCLTCGASTHTEANCSWENAMKLQELLDEERERAAIARHGGNVFRDHYNRLGKDVNDGNVRYWAEGLATGLYSERHGCMVDARFTVRLPEAAFDWPIYRVALDPTHYRVAVKGGPAYNGDLY